MSSSKKSCLCILSDVQRHTVAFMRLVGGGLFVFFWVEVESVEGRYGGDGKMSVTGEHDVKFIKNQ